MKSQVTLNFPTVCQGHFCLYVCTESANNISKNVLQKREFSHSGTEEIHVERQVLICNMKHVTHLIMCPWDMQCICKETQALKVIFERHKSNVSREDEGIWVAWDETSCHIFTVYGYWLWSQTPREQADMAY